MHRLLIVSPRFPPVNAPDLHRVRTSLPYFAKYGWQATVLCATPETTDGIMDPDLMATVPGDVRIERVAAWPETACRRFGFGHFNYRCLVPLYRRGAKLLARERFDVVYFSTSAALTFVLGPLWQRRFGCRVVFDFQDPWHSGVRRTYDRRTAPGGLVKYQVSRLLGRLLEPVALRAANGLIAVSPTYIESLKRDYPRLRGVDAAVIPFGAPFLDFDRLAQAAGGERVPDADDGLRHWVYAGAIVPHMWPVLDALFGTLAGLRREDAGTWDRVRLHFVGTSYAAEGATAHVARIAAVHGVGDLVIERTARVPYLQALRTLVESDGVLVIGSTLGEYTPSKLFLCALSGRPVLALMNAGSAVLPAARACPNVRVAGFEASPGTRAYTEVLRDGLQWLRCAGSTPRASVRAALSEHSAEALTRAQCELFDRLAAETGTRA